MPTDTSTNYKNPNKAPGSIRQRNMRKIIAAAETEFSRHGYKATSIQNIAERAGLPKANIHYYFSSKLELYAEILTRILKLWDTALNDMKPEDDPAIALSHYIRAKIDFSRRYPLASRIFALELMTGGEQLRAYYKQGYVEWFQLRCAVFQAWIDQGKLAATVDPAHLIFLLWSSTQHYADFSYQINAALGTEGDLAEAEYQKAADTLTTIILRGCGITVQSTPAS